MFTGPSTAPHAKNSSFDDPELDDEIRDINLESR